MPLTKDHLTSASLSTKKSTRARTPATPMEPSVLPRGRHVEVAKLAHIPKLLRIYPSFYLTIDLVELYMISPFQNIVTQVIPAPARIPRSLAPSNRSTNQTIEYTKGLFITIHIHLTSYESQCLTIKTPINLAAIKTVRQKTAN